MPKGIYPHKKGRKVKDTFKMSAGQKGNTNVRGKHWKVKNTSKMSAAKKGKTYSYKGGVLGSLARFGKDSYQYCQAVHRWVVVMKGKAKEYLCVDCGKQAIEWSNTNNHIYKQILKHYEPRCRSCHKKYDKKNLKNDSPENCVNKILC